MEDDFAPPDIFILINTLIPDSGLANVTGGNAAENLMIYMGTEGTWYAKDRFHACFNAHTLQENCY